MAVSLFVDLNGFVQMLDRVAFDQTQCLDDCLMFLEVVRAEDSSVSAGHHALVRNETETVLSRTSHSGCGLVEGCVENDLGGLGGSAVSLYMNKKVFYHLPSLFP